MVDSGLNGVMLAVNNTSTNCYSAFTHLLVEDNHNQNQCALIAHWYG